MHYIPDCYTLGLCLNKVTVGYFCIKENLALGLCILEARNACNHHTVAVTITIHTAFQKIIPSAKM